jgi:hypothetical protein
MGNRKTTRSILRRGTCAALAMLAMLAPGASLAGLTGDTDSYVYPAIGKYSRTDTGNGFSVKEKGESYGLGVFIRMPMSTRMEASPNVEAATEGDRRFIANLRGEFDFVRADLTASAGDAAAYDNTTYGAIGSASATGETKTRMFRCDGDVGYRIRIGPVASLEPYLGVGLVYAIRDIDGVNFGGHTTYVRNLNGIAGVRGEYDLGGEMSLFGEIGIKLPLYTRIKENLAPSVTFSPGLALSPSTSAGFRYAQYRIFLFHERTAYKEAASGNGITRPESKEDTVGLRFGLGY